MPNMEERTLTALGRDLDDRLTSLQKETAPYLRNVAVWWKWKNAEPRLKQRNFPFFNASNVVVPLIATVVDALTARTLAQVTAAAPTYWSTRTENESPERVRTARNMARYINWQADGNSFSLKHVLASSLPEMYTTGRSVLAISQREDRRPVFFGRQRAGLRRQMVTFNKGPLVEHVPAETVLWDRRMRIGDAPYVARYHEWTWQELRGFAHTDPAWSREAVESVKNLPGPDEFSELRRVMESKDETAGLDRDAAMLEQEVHGVWAIHADWSMLGNRFEVPGQEEWGGEQAPLWLHLHRRSGRVLRLTGNPYLLSYKPFVDLRWRDGDFGVAKALEQHQEMQTTGVNQGFDAQTRANALWGKTRNPKHNRRPLDPSQWLVVDSMDEVEPLNFGTSLQPNLALLTALQTSAERWMGTTDPLLGRETRSGGHPAPATSTLALLDQVNVMGAGTDIMFNEELGRVGEAVAMLDQQFEDNADGRLQQILGVEDAQSAGAYLFPDEPIPGNYFFTVAALSRSENPATKMQQAIQVGQVYQNYMAVTFPMLQAVANPQLPPQLRAAAVTMIVGFGNLLERFLAAANIDEGEDFLVRLEQLGIDSQNAFRQFIGEAQRAAAGPGGGPLGGAAGLLSGPGVGGPGNGVQGGAGRQFAGGGILQ